MTLIRWTFYIFSRRSHHKQSFIYIFDKPIDFSWPTMSGCPVPSAIIHTNQYRFLYRFILGLSYLHWLERSKSVKYQVLDPVPLRFFFFTARDSKPKIRTFGTFAKKQFLPISRICTRINVQDCVSVIVS